MNVFVALKGTHFLFYFPLPNNEHILPLHIITYKHVGVGLQRIVATITLVNKCERAMI